MCCARAGRRGKYGGSLLPVLKRLSQWQVWKQVGPGLSESLSLSKKANLDLYAKLLYIKY